MSRTVVRMRPVRREQLSGRCAGKDVELNAEAAAGPGVVALEQRYIGAEFVYNFF